MNCFKGIFHPAGRIEARGKLEANLIGPDRIGNLRDFFQCDDAWALRGHKLLQTAIDQNAIFTGERHHVGNGA